MPIKLQNSAFANALNSMRATGVSPAIPIEYAPTKQTQSGVTFFENAQQLVTFIGSSGWEKVQEARVQWAASPAPPPTLVNEVRTALRQATSGIGARAFTGGSVLFGQSSDGTGLAAHEATHVVQQRQGGGNQ